MRSPPSFPPAVRAALAALALVFATACQKAEPRPGRSGAALAESAPPTTRNIVCDFSGGSTCTVASLSTTLDALVPATAVAGSEIGLWMLGTEDPASTEQIASATYRPPTTGGKRALTAYRARFVAQTREAFLSAATRHFAQHRPARVSPIGVGLTRVARFEAGSRRDIQIYLVSDLRLLDSTFDFECGRLPSAERFLSVLHRQGLLTPGSLKGVSVTCVTDITSVDEGRCANSIERQAGVESLWTICFQSAGSDVRFVSRPDALGVSESRQ